jgi:hypothetical protein
MTANAIFGVAVRGFSWFPLPQLPEMRPSYSHVSLIAAHRPTSPHQEGTIVAKNRNQNRPQRDRQEERSGQGADSPQEHGKSTLTEEHVMPAATHVARKQQKKFGHN